MGACRGLSPCSRLVCTLSIISTLEAREHGTQHELYLVRALKPEGSLIFHSFPNENPDIGGWLHFRRPFRGKGRS